MPDLDRLRRRAIYLSCRALARRRFRYRGLGIVVGDGVFNPTFFRSSLLFAEGAVAAAPSGPADVLDLGSGCGMVSVLLARQGHRVTAVDRRPEAAANTWANAKSNGVAVRVLVSDWDGALVDGIGFDFVVCNPPFSTEAPPAFHDEVFAGPGLDSLRGALAAMGRRLRPGGRGFLLSSDRTGRVDLLEALGDAGLQVVDTWARRRWMEWFHLDVVAPLAGAAA